MAQNSKIEWTHHTVNLWHGCAKVHAGCDNCYAETLAHRWGNDIWGGDKPRKLVKSAFSDLDKFQKLAAEKGEKHRVFIGSMMDIFEKPKPVIDAAGNETGRTTGDLRRDLFHNITLGKYPNLILLLLTKRPSNINKYIPTIWLAGAPSNVMFGTSISNQETADNLIPQLARVKGKRFLSVEPQIDTVTLKNFFKEGIIHWVIQGGESGHYKRPFDTLWAESMRDECADYDVPYFFKQIDKVQEISSELMVRKYPGYHFL